MPHHIPEDRLELYSLGRLRERYCQPLEEHLLICEACRRRLKYTDEAIALIRSALRPRFSRPKYRP
jgi:LSD1 subclass zinc finger protein